MKKMTKDTRKKEIPFFSRMLITLFSEMLTWLIEGNMSKKGSKKRKKREHNVEQRNLAVQHYDPYFCPRCERSNMREEGEGPSITEKQKRKSNFINLNK